MLAYADAMRLASLKCLNEPHFCSYIHIDEAQAGRPMSDPTAILTLSRDFDSSLDGEGWHSVLPPLNVHLVIVVQHAEATG